MIYVNYIGNTILLIIAGVFVVALAILAVAVIRRNSRLEREKTQALSELESAEVGKTALKEQNGRLIDENDELHRENQRYRESVATTIQALHADNRRLLAENVELAARNTALVEAMEAQPTVPKRAVRKNSAPLAPGQEQP